MKIMKINIIAATFIGLFISACGSSGGDSKARKSTENADTYAVINTCTGTYPSYWQDPKFGQMWSGQTISDAPPQNWQGPVFQLSDKYPRQPVDDEASQPWRAKKFNALFNANTSQEIKKKLGEEYSWLVMNYVQAGNVNRADKADWDLCENKVRPWFHIPFQTYDAMSGREFTRGLTREAPVTFSVNVDDQLQQSTMWAVGFYNATAAYTLGQVWQSNGQAKIPTENISFKEGAVIAKPLFNTSSVERLPVLENMPSWNANISDPAFCSCKSANPNAECTLIEESQQCPRSTTKWPEVKLLQFDFAVKDSRAQGTEWVYGTFVADGQRKRNVSDQWQRISLLGVMWGNDTPPAGELAYSYPKDPAINGFMEEVIMWDTVEELNKYGGSVVSKRMGHLGCNNRLNGPADNANSSCMSCHGTASVPDKTITTPPLLSQFSSITNQCVTPDVNDPNSGYDRTQVPATVNKKIAFDAIDGIYFANTPAAAPFNMMTTNQDNQWVNAMTNNAPHYESGRTEWISLDYSLQMSISLTQWMQWQQHQSQAAEVRIHSKEILRGK
jgi:hypothetical protein